MTEVRISMRDDTVFLGTYENVVDTGISIVLYESDTEFSVVPYASMWYVDIKEL